MSRETDRVVNVIEEYAKQGKTCIINADSKATFEIKIVRGGCASLWILEDYQGNIYQINCYLFQAEEIEEGLLLTIIEGKEFKAPTIQGKPIKSFLFCKVEDDAPAD